MYAIHSVCSRAYTGGSILRRLVITRTCDIIGFTEEANAFLKGSVDQQEYARPEVWYGWELPLHTHKIGDDVYQEFIQDIHFSSGPKIFLSIRRVVTTLSGSEVMWRNKRFDWTAEQEGEILGEEIVDVCEHVDSMQFNIGEVKCKSCIQMDISRSEEWQETPSY